MATEPIRTSLDSSDKRLPRLVGIGEIVVSSDPLDIIVAPNLGSCLGIVMFDKVAHVGGMVHCMLPLSTSNPEKAKEKPCMYVDTGMIELMQRLGQLGADKRRLLIAVGGGANMSDINNVFEIGKKNHTVFKKVLWKNGLLAKGEHIGDSFSRTVTLHMEDGCVTVRARGETIRLV